MSSGVAELRLMEAIASGDRLLLDTSVLAAYLDRTEMAHPVTRFIVEELVGSGRNPAVISAVTVMEILIRPLRQMPPEHHTVLGFLHAQPHMSLVPVDVQVAQDAAHLRAGRRMNAPDALVVGTGLATQVRHLVTNDRAWGPKLAPMANRISVVVVSDYLGGADT